MTSIRLTPAAPTTCMSSGNSAAGPPDFSMFDGYFDSLLSGGNRGEPIDTGVLSQESIMASIQEKIVTELSQEVQRLVDEAVSSVQVLIDKWNPGRTTAFSPGSKTEGSDTREELEHEQQAIQNIIQRNSSYRRKLALKLQEETRKMQERDPAFDLAKVKQDFADMQTDFDTFFNATATEDMNKQNTSLKSTIAAHVRQPLYHWKGIPD
ncbi:hypothetical protein QFC22_006447 [Naganishia vaughanmartiniae]|uniref:Uncharacterized protein n=1 Tax=Naganishia vaughanmartiniae TaxID=1424756 RepID=A0ACC2WJ87_9TREE|nr:hypothetical protein QFC22_006447 [Naganishia vaughanmartiniae]